MVKWHRDPYSGAVLACALSTVLALALLNLDFVGAALILGLVALVCAILAAVIGSLDPSSSERKLNGGFLAIFGVIGTASWAWLVSFAAFFDEDLVYLCGHTIGFGYETLEYRRSYVPPAILCFADSGLPVSATPFETTLSWSIWLLVNLALIAVAVAIAFRKVPAAQVAD